MRKIKLLNDESGYILGLVMVFFVVFSMLGLAIMETGWHERLHGLKTYHRAQVHAYAEGGIHEGLWRLNKVSKAAATFSDANVSVTYDSIGLIMTAACTLGTVSKTIQVTVEETPNTPYGGWPYALYTDAKTLKLDEGTGTVTGDVHSNDDVKYDADYTINGTITTSPYVAPPTIDWNFFETEAQSVSQYSTSTLVFDAGGSPYTGVWYTTSDVDLKANAVINGTVVAEGKITHNEDDVTVTATPSNYPALICGGNFDGGKDNLQVTGLMYGDAHFDKDGTNYNLTGACIFMEDLHHSSTNFVVTYDANYTTNVAGTNIGGTIPGPTYKIKTWTEP